MPLSNKTEVEEILAIVPEWKDVYEAMPHDERSGKKLVFDFLKAIGAQNIYSRCLSLQEGQRDGFIILLRNNYFQPQIAKMLEFNQSLRRFWQMRHLAKDEQKGNCVSLSLDAAEKLCHALKKQLNEKTQDGFKVLLPGYIQRSVHNLVVDYVKAEWQWEQNTLQDMYLEEGDKDPRENIAADINAIPENIALSNEQVKELNQVRQVLSKLLIDSQSAHKEALEVIDCLFGMGLTKHSKSGQEMTMKECCEVLNLSGDSPARKIARCQVLLDKGLNLIRDVLRSQTPTIAQSWQAQINVNTASRRELNHHLGLTEGEVDRLIAARQFYSLQDIVDQKIIKAERLQTITDNGGTAAFTPIDINTATRRDIMDILGAGKELAQKIVDQRPFENLTQCSERLFLTPGELGILTKRGAVLKPISVHIIRIDLNKATPEKLKGLELEAKEIDNLLRKRPFGEWDEVAKALSIDENRLLELRKKAIL
jgi:DNA uptake protein ComE-like DNA-binding protein